MPYSARKDQSKHAQVETQSTVAVHSERPGYRRFGWKPNIVARPVSSFFVNDTATTEIYTLSLHDALPIFASGASSATAVDSGSKRSRAIARAEDRKSTRLNSSHLGISYAVFCLKTKK